MTLVVDNRERLRGRPGIHALIAGVSHYRHLPEGHGEPGTDTYGLKQLSTAATSAFRIYQWLKRRGDHLTAPLSTVRLLLSPADEEDEIDESVAPCTWANFVEAAHEWRADASVSNDDVTFFYFAGHGIIRDKADSVLMCDDFAQPRRTALPNVVAFPNIFWGMAPPADTTQPRALTQFYFIDACREFPKENKDFEKLEISSVFKSELSGTDDRIAPIFQAAISGSEAYASAVEQTLFSIALLDCLNGLAGEAGPENDDGSIPWWVTVFKLSTILDKRIEALNEHYNTDQKSGLVGRPKDIPIHYLDGPPTVEGTLTVVPEDAKPLINIDVLNSKQSSVWQPSLEQVYPYKGRLTAGSYFVKSTIREPPKPPYGNRISEPKPVTPPNFILKARPADD